jgi:hypothetical protein
LMDWKPQAAGGRRGFQLARAVKRGERPIGDRTDRFTRSTKDPAERVWPLSSARRATSGALRPRLNVLQLDKD